MCVCRNLLKEGKERKNEGLKEKKIFQPKTCSLMIQCFNSIMGEGGAGGAGRVVEGREGKNFTMTSQ